MESVLRLSQVLGRHDVEREVVSLDRPDDPWVKDCELLVHPMGSQSRIYKWFQRAIPLMRYGPTPHLIPWLRKNLGRFDVVILNGLWNFTAMATRIALLGRKKSYIVYPHGMLDPWFRKAYPIKDRFKQLFWLFIEGPLLRNAKFVVFVTEEEKSLAQNSFWPYKVNATIVGNGTIARDLKPENLGCERNEFRKAFPELAGKRFILFLSRIHKKKGCDLLLRAFAEVANLDPTLELVFAGPDQEGWIDKLDQTARDLNIASRIHWVGMLSGAAKWGAYHSCEAFILPSHSENFGVVVAEAMACSKPVLITNKVNIWREVKASGGGLVENDTLSGITKLLRDFSSLSEDKKNAMGRLAYIGFKANFDLENVANRFIEMLNCANGQETQ